MKYVLIYASAMWFNYDKLRVQADDVPSKLTKADIQKWVAEDTIRTLKLELDKHKKATQSTQAYLIRWLMKGALAKHLRSPSRLKNKNPKNRNIYTKAHLVRKFFEQISHGDLNLNISRSIQDEMTYEKIYLADIYQKALKEFKKHNALSSEM